MGPKKTFNLFAAALFLIFAGLSACCWGDCLDDCPYIPPPCLRVVLSGISRCGGIQCCDCLGDEGSSLNGEYMLPYDQDNLWSDGTVSVLFGLNTIRIWSAGFGVEVPATCPEGEFPAFTICSGVCDDPGGSCGGSAAVEMIWDCNACDYCAGLDIWVYAPKETIYYGREDCCPAGKGEATGIMMYCADANSIIYSSKIEVFSPNAPGGGDWVEADKSKLVQVYPPGSGCVGGDCIIFGVQALTGRPPARARVTCTATFFTLVGGETDKKSVTIYVEPGEGECCEDQGGGSGDGGGGSGGLAFSVGNASEAIKAGTNPVEQFSAVQVYDYNNGDVDIAVKLPDRTQYYILPVGFLPGWSASIDDNNDVTVANPDNLKYVYPESCSYRLTVIKDVCDVNIVIFDYNDTDPNLIDKQSDGFDPNFYIEYEYDANDLLVELTAWDYSDYREYTITYDDANRAIAMSGSCESCGGGGAFEYEYDANDLLKKVKKASDPNVVIYEYVRDSDGRVTQMYLGDINDGNFIREFDYTDINDGSSVVDIYDYVDAGNYRVTREYRNSAGLATKMVKYEELNEDPNDPVGESFIEHIVYYCDANSNITKKVVIPPLGDSNDPDPNSISGIRKEYTYDPNTFSMLTEKWFDKNDVNFTVSEYTYEYIADDNDSNDILNVRVKDFTDARGAKTEYCYDGNSVDPNLKTMPQVTTGISGTQQLKYEYTYDPNRNWIILERQLDIGDNLVAQSEYKYDSRGNLIERHDYAGDSNEITRYKYNGFNEMVRMISPSIVVQGWSYNDNGQLESEFVMADANDFNEPNDLALTLISQTEYIYDANGRIRWIKKADDVNTFTYGQPNGWVWTKYEYDLRGNRTKVIEDVNGLALQTTYEYNNQGEVIKVTLPNGKWTETYRDGRSLVIETQVGYGSTTAATTSFYYDDNGNLQWQLAPNAIWTKYEYDDFDRVKKVTKGL